MATGRSRYMPGSQLRAGQPRTGTVLFYARLSGDPVVQPLVADDSDRNWIQIARAGEWKGHHQGEFEFTSETFATMLANFEKHKNQPVPVTYGHLNPTERDLMGAAGWIHELTTREGDKGLELWAYVEFTERAAGMLKAGEHRFVSVEVKFDAKDPETGEDQGPTLVGLGLVLSPFIRGMKPASAD